MLTTADTSTGEGLGRPGLAASLLGVQEGAAACGARWLLNTLHRLSPRGPAVKLLGAHPKEVKIYART